MHAGIPDGAPEVIRLLVILHMLPARRPPLGGYKGHKQVPPQQARQVRLCLIVSENAVQCKLITTKTGCTTSWLRVMLCIAVITGLNHYAGGATHLEETQEGIHSKA